MCTLYDQSISLFGMSKTFGQPGLCIGWLICRDFHLLRLISEYKEYLSNGNPKPSEVIALISLRNRDEIIQRNQAIIEKNLHILDEFFKEFDEIFEWHRPQGGTMALVKIKDWAMGLGAEKGATGFCRMLMDEAGIMLVPSRLFNVEDSFVRIGFGRKDMKDCLDVLGGVLRDAAEKQAITKCSEEISNSSDN
jgi:aspartate/methionine/tyrosine aminotransferase